MSKQFLTEDIQTTFTLVEGTGDKLIVRGKFGECDRPTKNGRIYPRKLMQREIDRLAEDMKNRSARMLGHLDHPESGKTSLTSASHLITKLEINGDNDVIGEAEILLNLPHGHTLKVLAESGIKVGVSSRALGSTAPSRGKYEGEEVQEDFVLKTYDFVADPAVASAVPMVHKEDIDDMTLVERIIEEFPDVAQELRGSEGAPLTEAKIAKNEILDKVRSDLSEKFERQLRDAMVELREEVSAELREEFEDDPEVAGAKGVLQAISDMVSAYRGDTDPQAVKDAIKAAELSVSEANTERDKAQKLAQKAAYMLHIEKQIGKHPMAESLRKMLQKQDFDSKGEVEEAVKTALAEAPNADSVVDENEVKLREENMELRGKIALLESKVEELRDKSLKAAKLSERIEQQRIQEAEEATAQMSFLEDQISRLSEAADRAKSELREERDEWSGRLEESELEVYKRDKVVGFTNGRQLLGQLEGISDRTVVDELVESNGTRTMMDPTLQAMRASQAKGRTGTGMHLEESGEKKPKRRIAHDVDEFAPMDEIRAMSGIQNQ